MIVSEILHRYGLKKVLLVSVNDCGVFQEIMMSLCGRLKNQGVDASISYQMPSDPNTLHIIYNGHSLKNPINVPYIIHNYEQCGSRWVHFPNYKSLIEKAIAVFDYSEYNKDKLESLFGRQMSVIPHGYHESIVKLPLRTDNAEPIDVLFYGALNDHRRMYQQKFEVLAPEIRIKFISNYSLFWDRLIEEMKNTKIILNLHYYNNPSILEQSRIVPAICNSRLVLSEKSSDTAADARFDPMVVFITPETIIETCRKYLNCPELRFQRVQTALEILKAEQLPL